MEMKERSELAREKRGGQQKVKGEDHSRRRVAGAKTVRRERGSTKIKVKGQRKRSERKGRPKTLKRDGRPSKVKRSWEDKL